ncbi:InlB B-repeat-containing protein, partial [Candidatus Saccharibacteria bacterium]|nr:InlB B-repeat-containing protein [Candidatus Saccharibacteria bacterium]
GTNQHVLTYGVKLAFNTTEGVYQNTFVVRAVTKLEPCDALKVCYFGNGDDETGTMEDQDAASNSDITLIPSNFSRSGYGFAGWDTAPDGSGTTYGPSEAITTGDLSTEGLQLFAKWVPSSGTLQGFIGCDAMSIGDITALTDTRDGNTYAVAKEADGQCWMIENLRLDLSDPDLTITIANTHNPSTGFMDTINNTHPASSNSFCESTSPDAACVDQILHNTNNINRSLTASYDANDDSSSWYSYGVYYNWYTATAGYGTYSFRVAGVVADGDICPAGWRLPTGYGDNGDYARLDVALGGTGRNQGNVAGSKRWRKYPLNYIYSGEYRGLTEHNRDVSGGWATSNTQNSQRAVNFWLQKQAVNLNSNTNLKPRGQTVRCVSTNDFSAVGNIHYDANGGSGTVADAIDVDFRTTVAANNGFTMAHAEFNYWNTEPDGSGTIVLPGRSVAFAASEMGVTDGETLTLYAVWQSVFNIVYDGNGSDDGVMSDSLHGNLINQTYLNLIASNYSRTGYGFIGWSFDQNAGSKFMNGESVEIYGPNERVKFDNTFFSHADADNKIQLYAVWIPADANKTMQTFSSSDCSSLNIGGVLALEDERDNDVYAVAKLADGHCWMIENLRLIPSQVTFDSQNTNLPTSAFISAAPSSASSNVLCGIDSSSCVDTVAYNANNIDRNLTPVHNGTTRTNMWYSYGVMYNWYTASAGNGDFNMSGGDVVGDLCPAGWRLPIGGDTGEFVDLNNVVNHGNLDSDLRLRIFPNNFIYSGDYNRTKYEGRASYGRYWSSTAADINNAYRLGIKSDMVTPANMYNKWDAFAIRCIVK